MTRISIALVAIFALVVCACERQPVPGQTVVTHIHDERGHIELRRRRCGNRGKKGNHFEEPLPFCTSNSSLLRSHLAATRL